MELIGTFGFHTSADTDKFAACASAVDGAEVPYVTEHGLARFSVSVTETIDVGSHYLFVGVVEEAEMLAAGDPLTYAYYHAVKGGKTPPKAATYNNGDEAAVPGVTETAAGAPESGKKIALALHHLRLHRGRLPGRPARGLHVPHLRRSSRDVRARGTIAIPQAHRRGRPRSPPAKDATLAPCSKLEKPRRLPSPGLWLTGGYAGRLQRAVAPVFQTFDDERVGRAPLRGGAWRRPRTRRRTARRRRAPRTRRDP